MAPNSTESISITDFISQLCYPSPGPSPSGCYSINTAIDFIRSTVCIRSDAKEFTSGQADKEFLHESAAAFVGENGSQILTVSELNRAEIWLVHKM